MRHPLAYRALAGCACRASNDSRMPRSASRASRSGARPATSTGCWRCREQVWRDRAYGDLWSYALLAEGLIDITGEFDVKPYDLAALVPIVEEAGGRFTSITGEPGPWHGSSLATNGLLHDAVLEVLADRAGEA